MKKIIIFFIIIIVIILGVSGLKLFFETKNRISLDLDYRESTNTLWNPERGWYKIHGFKVTDELQQVDFLHDVFLDQYHSGDSLMLMLFNLKEYRDGEISKEGLDYIDNVMNNVRQTGVKAIIRFVYDWDGYGIENEPDDIQIILNHMEQLAPYLNTYQDVIYLVQGIFVGSYGEMHSSKYLDEGNVTILMDKLLESTPENIMLSVRTPEYWRLITDSNEPIHNLTQLPGARIGLYNDGLCSSETDLGTYSDGTEYVDKWLRTEEVKFQSELCQLVPNGGELALESEYNDLDTILNEFPMLHISYLNKDYNKDVLEKWKMSTYKSENQKDPYEGVDGYKYVGDHLGYRFVLRSVTKSKRIFININSELEVEVENTGFSNMYYPKDISLLLEGVNSGDEIRVQVDTDIRNWESGETTKFNIAIPTKKLQEDDYNIYLQITDEYKEEYGIQMANDSIFDSNIMANSIGQIQIERLSFKNIWK